MFLTTEESAMSTHIDTATTAIKTSTTAPVQILRIDSSLFGEGGVSTQLNQSLVAQLSEVLGEVHVVHRDFAKDPLPHFSADVVAAISTPAAQRSPEQHHLANLADQLIAEVQRADILVIAAPMYNFGVPSTLKVWMDFIARAGVTFRYSSNGPEGLLLNKTAYIVTTRGGIHKGQGTDSEVPFIQTFFNFLGITDLRFIYAEGINMGQKEHSMVLAEDAIRQAVAA
jgi:FMN-dependent NADH-azoreductase